MRSAHNILNFDIGVESIETGTVIRLVAVEGDARVCYCCHRVFSPFFSICFEHKRTAASVAVVVLSERALTTHRVTFQLVCNLMRSNPVFYFN